MFLWTATLKASLYLWRRHVQIPLYNMSTRTGWHSLTNPCWNTLSERGASFLCKRMDGWVSVLRPFNSISVISRWWKGEHERLCAMKRRLGSGRISPPEGFEPATPCSEVGRAKRSATRTLLYEKRESISNQRFTLISTLKLWMQCQFQICIVLKQYNVFIHTPHKPHGPPNNHLINWPIIWHLHVYGAILAYSPFKLEQPGVSLRMQPWQQKAWNSWMLCV